jgi:predicted Rossmann fold flavoprotein
VVDGAPKPGAKILVSGGGRCNVTNASVTEADFWGGRRTIVRHVLRGLPVPETVRFFADLGVPLHEEADGKLFPDTNRARDVLDALMRAAFAAGARLAAATRVTAVAKAGEGFDVHTSGGTIRARRVVLATGGRSLPKTGSDGAGYDLAAALGHTIVPTTPALAPLVLDAAHPAALHARLPGVSHDAEITIRAGGKTVTLRGSLLWTHFGISGPVALNASRHWARARLDDPDVDASLSFFPGRTFDSLEAAWIAAAALRPRATLQGLLGGALPESLAHAVLDALRMDGRTTIARWTRDDRRRLARALLRWPLPILDTRGYNYAEATAGGVDLTEIDPATMESRVCPGLYLVGEILDVDGRIGGFNFQWAWATGKRAGEALARR